MTIAIEEALFKSSTALTNLTIVKFDRQGAHQFAIRNLDTTQLILRFQESSDGIVFVDNGVQVPANPVVIAPLSTNQVSLFVSGLRPYMRIQSSGNTSFRLTMTSEYNTPNVASISGSLTEGRVANY